MGRLREAVEDAFSFTRVILIIGASANKDCDGMARELAHLHPEVIITRSSHPRSAPPEALVELFVNLGLQTRSTSSVQDAMRLALQHASPDDLVLVTGSLFVVAEALAWWQEGAAR
jgi:dihydrofolate synthase/folylpolyglutamate synthase